MAAVAKLMENEKIDLDKEVQDYVPEFPKKCFANKEVCCVDYTYIINECA